MSDLDVYLTGGDDQNEGCSGCVPNQFYESITPENATYANFENSLGQWIQGTADSHNWTLRSGPTPTGSTGPVCASSGINYYYLETSSGNANIRHNSAILESPTVSGSERFAVFDYHMHGAGIGTLNLDFFDGTRRINSIWSVSGEQQFENENPWLNARVKLPDGGLGNIRVRLRAVAIGGAAGDIVIDNITASFGARIKSWYINATNSY
jgi:hypothetical protein